MVRDTPIENILLMKLPFNVSSQFFLDICYYFSQLQDDISNEIALNYPFNERCHLGLLIERVSNQNPVTEHKMVLNTEVFSVN